MPELWQDYLFLTKELYKFVKDTNSLLFKDLVAQRERLLEIINESTDEENYIKSDEGRHLIKEAISINEKLKDYLVKERNLLTRNFEINSAYEGFSSSIGLGNRFDSGSKY